MSAFFARIFVDWHSAIKHSATTRRKRTKFLVRQFGNLERLPALLTRRAAGLRRSRDPARGGPKTASFQPFYRTSPRATLSGRAALLVKRAGSRSTFSNALPNLSEYI